MHRGFVLFYRSILDHPMWLSEKFDRPRAWIDLFLLANHKDSYFRVRGVRVNIKRGQVGYGTVALAKRWQWSRGKVTRFLNELESDGQIEQQKSNVTTLITIVNYEKYQGKQTAKRAAKGTANRTTGGQLADSRQSQTNNVKNKNNENKTHGLKKSPDPGEPPAGMSIEDKFREFWKVWPRKDAKLDAKKAFEKLDPDDDLLRAMIDAIIKTLAIDRWQDKKYIPLPATWIRGERWNDEIEPPNDDDFQKRSDDEWQHIAAELGIEEWRPGMPWPDWIARVEAAEQRAGEVA